MKRFYSLVIVLTVIGCFVLSATHAQLFQQQFGTNVTAFSNASMSSVTYINASPSNAQFTSVTSTGASATISVASNRMTFARTGNGWSFARGSAFSGPPSSLMIQFDFSVTASTAAQTSALVFAVGGGTTLTTTAASLTNADVHTRLAFNTTANANEFVVRDIAGGTNGVTTFSGTQTVLFVVNNSGGSLNYRGPDGSNESVGDDKFDVWVGTSKQLDERNATTTSQTLSFFKCIWNGGSNTVNFTNMLMDPIPTAPTSTAASSVATNSFSANWNAVSGASGYRLDVATDAAFTSPVPGYSNLDVGNVTTYSVTGLNPSTTYYYRVRSYNTYTVSTFNSGNSASQNTTTNASGCTAPSTQPNSFSANTVTSTTANIAFTRGNGDNVLIIGRAGSAVATNPASGISYGTNNVTNQQFGSGDAIGSGFVVYNGAASGASAATGNIALSNLSSGTTYYFAAYEYNNTGNCYNITSPLTGLFLTRPAAPTATAATSVTSSSFVANWGSVSGATAYLLDVSLANDFSSFVSFDVSVAGTSQLVSSLTPGTTYYYRVRAENSSGASTNSNVITVTVLATEPTAQPTSFTRSAVTTTGMTLSWTAATGTPDGYIVLRTTASGTTLPNTAPVDGTTYTAGNTLGNATVEYVGSNLSTPMNSTLVANSQYSFYIYSYNGSGSAINYFTTSPLQGQPFTLATEPTTQSSLSLSTKGHNSITLTISHGNGTSSLIVAKAGSAVDQNPVDGASGYTAAGFGSGTDLGSSNFIVHFNTTGTTTVAIAGLSPSTTYHFAVYSFNGTNANSNANFNTTAPGTFSTSTTEATPTTASSALVYGTTTTTTIPLSSWTPGNGANRIVVARLSATSAVAPTNGNSYTANSSSFTDGLNSTTGTGNVVVYNGNGSGPVTVSGLTAGSLYAFDIYEYNGSGTTAGYGSVYTPTTKYTLQTQPAHSASFTASSVGSVSLTLNFDATTTTSGYLILRRTGSSASTGTPSNSTSYSAGNTIGDGTVAAFITANSTSTASITGLTAATQYTFSIIPFGRTATNVETYNYNTNATIPTVTVTTLATAPTAQPTSLQFSSVTSSGFTVSFTAATGSPAGYLVLRRTGSAPTGTPVNGTAYTQGQTNIGSGTNTVAYVGSGTSFAESGLADNTTYFYTIYSYNGSNETTAYFTTSPLSGSQATSSVSAPTPTAATSVTHNSFAANWGNVSGASSYELDVSTSSTFGTTSFTTLVAWNFPNATDDATADAGIAANTSKTISTVGGTSSLTFNASGATTSAVNATSWDGGSGTKYWMVDFVATGYYNIRVSSKQRASGTGPRDFKLQYRVGAGGTWTDVSGATVTTASNYSSGVLTNVALPAECNNKSSIFLRWIMTSNTNVNGTTVASGGTSQIDDILIEGNLGSFVSGYEGLSVAGITQSVTGLSANTTYYYRLKTIGSSSTSGYSTSQTVTTYANDIATADFRSKNSSGNYSSASSWQFDAGGSYGYVDATQAPTSTNNINVQNGHTITLTANITVGTGKTLTINGTLDADTYTITGLGTVTINGTLKTANASGFTTAVATSTVNTGASSTVHYTGSSQTVTAGTYVNLNFTGTTGLSLPAGTVNVSGTFTPGPLTSAGQGTIRFSGSSQTIPAFNYNNLDLTGASSVSFASGTIGIAGTFTPDATTTAGSGSTIEFNGAAQNIPSFTYNHLTVSNGSNKTATGALTVNGDFTVSNGTEFRGGSFTHNLKGNWVNNLGGTFTAQTCKFVLNGTSAQTMQGSTFYDLEINNNSGVTMNTNEDVTNSLTLTAGVFNLNGNTLTLSNGSTIIRSGGSLSAAPVFGSTGTDRVNVTISGTCSSGEELNGTTGGVGTLTVSSGTYTLGAAATVDNLTVTSVLDATDKVITARASGAVTINGTFRTAVLDGFSGSATTAISNTNTPTITLGASSTIEYNATSGTQTVQGRTDYVNLTLSGGASKTISSGIEISGNFTVSGGTATPPATMTFDGSSTQSISGLAWTNLAFSGASTKQFTSDGSITGTLSVSGNNVTIDADGPSNNIVFTLQSSASATARIADLTNGNTNTGNSITGNITAERYIGNGVTPKRAWRLLSAPVTGVNIFDAWQDGGSNASGYGTRITGSGGGFDAGSTSIKTWNGTAWVTNQLLATNSGDVTDYQGYMVFVRGDRTTSAGVNVTPVDTRLRPRGTVRQGTFNSYVTVPNTAGYTLLGNPYASAIDFEAINADYSDLTKFYAWDPQQSGNYGVGAYNLVERTGAATYDVTPQGGSAASNNTARYIPQGVAVLVHNPTGAGSAVTVDMKESYKTSSSSTLNYYRTTSSNMNMAVNLATAAAQVIDGVRVRYDASYSNNITAEDAQKLYNNNENIAISSQGQFFIVEKRNNISQNDTVQLRLTGMRQQQYQLVFYPADFSGVSQAYVEDTYLNSITAISLVNTTTLGFTVDANAASTGNRFRIVFRTSAPLPVTFNTIRAYQRGSGVMVEWNVSAESNIRHYEVERSSDGRSFSKLGVVNAKGNNNSSAEYNYTDASPLTTNYYRVKSVGVNGEEKYSAIVRVNLGKGAEVFTVYPNPVKGDQLSVQLSSLEKGRYMVRMINAGGQVVLQQQLVHGGGSATEQVTIPPGVSRGIYRIELRGENMQVTKTIVLQ